MLNNSNKKREKKIIQPVPLDKRNKRYLYYNAEIPASIDVASLSPGAVRLVGYLVYRMGQGEERGEDFSKYGLLPLPSKTLRSVFGADSSKYMQELVDKQIVERGKHSSGAEYSAFSHICMTYQFTAQYEDDRQRGRFTLKLIRIGRLCPKKSPDTPVTRANSNELRPKGRDPKEYSPYQKALVEKTLRSYDLLTVLPSWQELWGEVKNIPRELAGVFHSDEWWTRQIHLRKIRVTVGDCGRLFHPMIQMRRQPRSFIRHNGKKLMYTDAKSAHVFLLAKFAADNAERDRWLALFTEGDFYSIFIEEGFDRNAIKEQFQKAISWAPKGPMALRILGFIREQAPGICAWLEKQWAKCDREGKVGNTPQFLLQRLESEIFVRAFHELEFWSLPLHDGLALMEETVASAIEHLQGICRKVLGFELIFEAKSFDDFLESKPKKKRNRKKRRKGSRRPTAARKHLIVEGGAIGAKPIPRLDCITSIQENVA